MKKLLAMAALVLSVLPIVAQDDKPKVFVEKFVNKAGVSNVASNNLKQELMAGLSATDRLVVIDAATIDDLSESKNERLGTLGEMGIQFYIEGTLNSVDTKKKTTESDGKKTVYWEATINYTLTVIDTETGITKATETLHDSYTIGDTEDEAILKAIERAKKRMTRFVDTHFKVEAVIKALDEVDKKGVKTCYISTGSNAGIVKGQIFEVFSQIEIAGEKVNKKIGELKAEEVLSGTLTKCSVKNGGADIKNNFDNKVVMTVISRAKKENIFNKGGSLLGL